jgi:hypothetical protein
MKTGKEERMQRANLEEVELSFLMPPFAKATVPSVTQLTKQHDNVLQASSI